MTVQFVDRSSVVGHARRKWGNIYDVADRLEPGGDCARIEVGSRRSATGASGAFYHAFKGNEAVVPHVKVALEDGAWAVYLWIDEVTDEENV